MRKRTEQLRRVGQRPFSPKSSGWYRDVTSMSVSFVTDAQRLADFPETINYYLQAKAYANPMPRSAAAPGNAGSAKPR